VTKLTIHKLDPNAGDRKGEIITVEIKDILNKELAQLTSIQICQALMLMADDRCTIHHYGERGEQNNCWVEPNYHWESPATCTIRDKYWGDKQIEDFRSVCRLMCRVHGWELIDETVGLLGSGPRRRRKSRGVARYGDIPTRRDGSTRMLDRHPQNTRAQAGAQAIRDTEPTTRAMGR
jgi:hypothetical protein